MAVDFEAAAPPQCTLYRDRQQIVWNLLSNVVRFTPKNGRIEVVLEMLDSQVELRVSDTGVWISEDFLPYVFDRFGQADASSTRERAGMGIGHTGD